MRGVKLLTCIQSTHPQATLAEDCPISLIPCYDFTAIRPDTRENYLIRCTHFFPTLTSLLLLFPPFICTDFLLYDFIWHIGALF
jgi:hypothetical protein